jgi:hypothetical protein
MALGRGYSGTVFSYSSSLFQSRRLMERLDPRLDPETHARVAAALLTLSLPASERYGDAMRDFRSALASRYELGPDLADRLQSLIRGPHAKDAVVSLIADYAPLGEGELRRLLLDPGSGLDRFQRSILVFRCVVPFGDDAVVELLGSDHDGLVADALLWSHFLLPPALAAALYRRYCKDPVRGPRAASLPESPDWVKRDALRNPDPAFRAAVETWSNADPASRAIQSGGPWTAASEANAPEEFELMERSLRDLENADPNAAQFWSIQKTYRGALQCANADVPEGHRERLLRVARNGASRSRAVAQLLLVEHLMVGEEDALGFLADAVERQDAVLTAAILGVHVMPKGDDQVLSMIERHGDFLAFVVLKNAYGGFSLPAGSRVIRHLYEMYGDEPEMAPLCVAHPSVPLDVLNTALKSADAKVLDAIASSRRARLVRSVRGALLRAPSANAASHLLADRMPWECDDLIRAMLRSDKPGMALAALEQPAVREACTLSPPDLSSLFGLEDPLERARAMALLPLLPKRTREDSARASLASAAEVTGARSGARR